MNNDQELALCEKVETWLSAKYSATPELTDALCMLALDNAVIALKHRFQFAKNETVHSHPLYDDIVASVVDIGVAAMSEPDGPTLKDFVHVIRKIRKSVVFHSANGPRAYYEFIEIFV